MYSKTNSIALLLYCLALSVFCVQIQQERLQVTIKDALREVENLGQLLDESTIINTLELLKSKASQIQVKEQDSNLDLSICSKKVIQECNHLAQKILNECQDNDGDYCWRKVTFVYPKCLKCYCLLPEAQACSAANLVLYAGYKISDNLGCSNLLQSQCIPFILGIAFQVPICKHCMCLAQKKGYKTYMDCDNHENYLNYKDHIVPKINQLVQELKK